MKGFFIAKNSMNRKPKKSKNVLTRQRSYTLSPEQNCRQVGSIQSFANRDSHHFDKYIKNALTTRPRRLSELDSNTGTPNDRSHQMSALSQVRFTDNSLDRFRPRNQRGQRPRLPSKNRDFISAQYKSTQALQRPRSLSNSERPEKMRKLISAPMVVGQHGRERETLDESTRESLPKRKSNATVTSDQSNRSVTSIRQILHRLCPSLR
ncbi:Oidioi.mRNA.OKI2018_I69.XSR.g16296.t1.cds [Oikopleura dioica]|uniref:Oidioi.mRNA.OKI2018_I69.XSR.g16296.t1.cds n=1 Tax=Oikopleura dioica TaxID=34765 RepID=A0ABN7SLZ0_OIKDI|nr:Oidioi.mRNA.OKI2018_I69.XSR.g16296.t1.cds [Oikopleura dioica]